MGPRLKSALAAAGRAQALILSAFLYYVVLTPYSAVLRLFGVKFLDLDIEEGRDSYWLPRPPSDPAETARRLD